MPNVGSMAEPNHAQSLRLPMLHLWLATDDLSRGKTTDSLQTPKRIIAESYKQGSQLEWDYR